MGLDVSHDCFSGAYSSFTRWRNELTKAAGLKTVPTPYGFEALDIDWERFTEDNLEGIWENPPDDPLLILLIHSDCDGIIPHEYCEHLANRLEQLLPNLDGDGVGHIARLGIKGTTNRFIDGLRLAHERSEDVEFC